MKKTPEQQFKLALTAVLIALLVVVTGLAFVYKNHQQDLIQKDLKISVLIKEIGEIKDQNEKLHQYFNSEKNNIEQAVSQMTNVQQKLNEIDIDTAKQNELQKVLAATNGNLMELIQKKEQTINSLEEKSKLLAQTIHTSKMPGYLNILILGENMGLTDTIMLASINQSTKKVTLISLPRDLFYNGRKINEYYEKFGIDEMEKAVEAITGVSPDKYVVVDMRSFSDVVDMVGGIDLNVPKAIVDNSYPGANRSYIMVTFKQGYQHMDGERALKYVRSRKSTTDFDRSARQQLVLLALKQKAEELNLKEDVVKLTEIYNGIKDRIKTDISLLDVMNYYNDFRTYEIKAGNTISNQNFLYSTHNSAGQYILLPNKGSYTALQTHINKIIAE